jgi:hypothetical protein
VNCSKIDWSAVPSGVLPGHVAAGAADLGGDLLLADTPGDELLNYSGGDFLQALGLHVPWKLIPRGSGLAVDLISAVVAF